MNPLLIINSSGIQKMNSPSAKKTRMRRVLIFDVETTGLINKKETDLTKMPYIIQLSFLIFNIEIMEIEQKYNEYIKIAPEIEIIPKITELTGITREICDNKGISINRALLDFHDAYIQCDCIVAHNLEFDSKLIQIETERNISEIRLIEPHYMNIFNKYTDLQFGIIQYCTMKNSMNLSESKNKMSSSTTTLVVEKNNNVVRSQYKKWLRLGELYEKIFHTIPLNLHNSWFDTIVCFRCFMVIKFQYRIPDEYYAELLRL